MCECFYVWRRVRKEFERERTRDKEREREREKECECEWENKRKKREKGEWVRMREKKEKREREKMSWISSGKRHWRKRKCNATSLPIDPIQIWVLVWNEENINHEDVREKRKKVKRQYCCNLMSLGNKGIWKACQGKSVIEKQKQKESRTKRTGLDGCCGKKRNTERETKKVAKERGRRSDAFICSLPAPIKDPSMNPDIHLPQKHWLRKKFLLKCF